MCYTGSGDPEQGSEPPLVSPLVQRCHAYAQGVLPLLGSFALDRLKLLAQFGELLGNEESISRIVDIAAVVNLNGKEYYIGVAVRKNNDGTTGYYIHEAAIIKKTGRSSYHIHGAC